MRIENAVTDEALAALETVSKIQIGTDEYDKGVNSVTKLVDRTIEMEKVEIERRKLDIEDRKLDVEEAKLEADKRNQFRKDLIGVGTFVVTTASGLLVVMETFRFDRTDTPTSTLGRTILAKFVPKLFK